MLNFNDQAILMEYIEGSPLKELVIQGKDEEATHIIGQTITKIHSAPKGQAHQFETLEHRFEALFAHAKKDAPDIIKRAAMFAKDMLNNQKDIRLLHGDIHHENIMQRSNSEWVAIDPQPLIGDRAYDCANTLHNPHQMPHKTESKERLLNQATIVSKITGLNKQQIIDYAFIHGCLSACWSIDDQTGTFSNSPAIKTSEILEGSISKNLS